MRTPRLPLCKRGNLHLRSVEVGVIRKQHVRARLGDDVTESEGGRGVRLQPCLVWPEVERGATPRRGDMTLTVVEHRHDRRHRARRMPRRDVHRQCRVAEGQLLAIGHDHVALGFPRRILLIEHVPVGRGHQDACAELVLQVLGAAGVIEVPVADEDVLDVSGIESELLQAADHFVFNRVVVDCVDQDDALRCRDRPRRELGHPDVVHVVEDLRRLGVPRLACRRRRRAPAATAATGSCAAATRLTNRPRFGADAVEETRVFFPGCNFGGRDVFLHLRRRLSGCDRQS